MNKYIYYLSSFINYNCMKRTDEMVVFSKKKTLWLEINNDNKIKNGNNYIVKKINSV